MIDPFLLTFEVQTIIDWFRKLAQKTEKKRKILEFLEPIISFELLNEFSSDIKKIKISLEQELTPDNEYDDTEYFVIFEATKKGLNNLADELEKELFKFPIRK